ncbi:MFS gliotoxin efflux transporter GliA [Coccidioides immitis RS]|uniref:MFS gliotoxin efflux transporter GliA n=2 Tax=Coccidioides immitis TaxID=5501 RepID=J3KI62_COCIM|nr:MFS gliotoxin efflux transporter GliA [Coccidioides immitis RS]EAS35631.3 MFS gliotoxin efflux transporter GliA [Coccidioides immitis RS]
MTIKARLAPRGYWVSFCLEDELSSTSSLLILTLPASFSWSGSSSGADCTGLDEDSSLVNTQLRCSFLKSRTIVATAIPKITDEFHGLDKVSWYGSAFFMTNGGFQSSWGKAYKYIPLKMTFLLSILVLELGSLICAVAPNSTTLIAGRAISGLGAAGIGTGAYTIIAFVAEPRKRAMFTGIIGESYGFASVAEPLIGGVLSRQGVVAAKPVPASWKEKLLQMDIVGIAMIMGAVVTYILALQYGGQSKAWNSAQVIGLLVAFVVILIVFCVWERFQRERAMVIPRLFKQRTVGISCICTFFFSGSYFLVIYYLPVYSQSVENSSPAMSDGKNLPLIMAVTLAMISSGVMISATGLVSQTKVVGSIISIIASGLLYTLDVDTSTDKWIGYQILGGIGWGIAFQVPIIVGQSVADPKDIPKVKSSSKSLFSFFMNAGGTSFVSAGQSAFVNKLIATIPATAPGINPATVVATGATQIRTTFPANNVPGIVLAYMAGIKVALAMSIGGAGAAFITSLFSDWKRLNKKAMQDANGAV